MPSFRHLSWTGRLFFVLIIAGGAAIVPIGLLVHPLDAKTIPELVYLGVATQVAALLPVKWGRGNMMVWTAPMVAAGLIAPGGGVAVLAWVATYDGRRPGRDVSVVAFLWNRGMMALTHGIPSLLLSGMPRTAMWAVPAIALAYGVAILLINYPLNALAFSIFQRTSVLRVMAENAGAAGLLSVIFLAFTGGIIYVLLEDSSGFLLVPGLFGVLWVMRSNVAYANRQREARLQTIQLAAQALDARDPYTESHSQRVSDLAVKLAEALGLTTSQQDLIRTAGHLHDLGKIGVPDHILMKAGGLTDQEWAVMRTHADVGADMLDRHSEFAAIAPMVRFHHERWNGSGYPRGLSGASIPLGGRILAVADSYDTITEARLYRPTKLTPASAVEDITGRSGTWYDPTVVDALRQIHGMATLPPVPSDRSDQSPHRRGFGLLRARPRFGWLTLGMTVSSLGDPLTTVATLVAIYAVSRSTLAVAGAYAVKASASVVTAALLGSASDRFPRNRLILMLELVRAALLVLAPFVLLISIWLVVPLLYLLATANGIVQPARQAAVGDLVRTGELGSANAVVSVGDMTARVVGFPLAAGILAISASSLNLLFVIDGLTFAVAGLTMLKVGEVGGINPAGSRLSSAITDVWRVAAARPHLSVAAFSTLFLAMSFPILISLAYQFPHGGALVFTILEAALSAGVIVGGLVLTRIATVGAMRTCGLGLGITGAMSLAVAVAPSVAIAAGVLFLASIGNPVYAVGNQTALMEAVPKEVRGRAMAVRLGITQVLVIVGSGIGAVLDGWFGPKLTYAVLGIGLCAVGAYVFRWTARSRRTESAPTNAAQVAAAPALQESSRAL